MKQSRQLSVAISAAYKAGRILMQLWKKKTIVHFKEKTEMVTAADKAAEKVILADLRKNFPSYSIFSEEMGRADKKSDYLWVVDPLDGTTNFVIHDPFFNTAIALVYKGEVVLGVVYYPFLDEMFWAEKGKGAFMNGKRINVSAKTDFLKSVFAFCHSGYSRLQVKRMLRIYSNLKLAGIKHLRQIGSAELELCYVACGRIESFHISDLNLYDVAAGSVIVKEAGGRVTDFKGRDWKPNMKDIFASNGLVHNKLLKLINRK